MTPSKLGASVLLLVATTSCGNLGLSDDELMDTRLPEAFRVEAPAGRVWSALIGELDSKGHRVMARDDRLRFVSWIEIVPGDAVDPIRAQAKDPEDDESVPTLNSALVRPLDSGCDLYLRRVYYLQETSTGLVHSRGDYERKLLEDLSANLGLGGPR